MTRHRSQQDRIEEILEAAATEIHTRGYSTLTMEAIVGRTSLSKGGVYRFFANKRDVALALFRRILESFGDFDEEEALGWGLPLGETMRRIQAGHHFLEPDNRDLRVWLQLLPETLWDADFAAEKARQEATHLRKYEGVIRRIVARDALPVRPDFDARLETALAIGLSFMEGASLMALGGVPRARIVEQIDRFIEVMVRDALP